MNFPVKAIIFDWAGTVVDFGCMAPVEALLHVFANEGVEISSAEARADMGRAKLDHLRAILAAPQVAERWLAAKGAKPAEADVNRIYAALEPEMVAAAGRAATLIPGAADMISGLRSRGIRIGSGTGYTREMMLPVLAEAKRQGYDPEVVICSGETPSGRPSPLMTWAALVALNAYPAEACVKVDDAPVGIVEGASAGCWTIGLAASGNGVGLSLDDFQALDDAERDRRVEASAAELYAAGASYVVNTIAELGSVIDEIAIRIEAGERPARKHP